MSSSESDFSLGDSDFDDDFEVKKPKSSTVKTTNPSAKSPAKNNKRKADTAPSSASKSLKTSVSSSKSISRPVAPATLPSASLVAEPVSSEASARKLILSYMRTQNRPYSVIQVFDNLHKRVGKALVQKILDALSEPSGPLKCKEYGKAKIYYLDQNQLDDVTSPEEMQRISDTCDELNERYVALQQQLHAVDVELKALVDAPPDNKLDSLLADMETKCSELQQRTQHITSSTVTPKQRNDIVASYNFYRDAWRSRKNKAMEIVEMLADGMEKKTKDVLALIGLETDEDEGVSLPPPVKGEDKIRTKIKELELEYARTQKNKATEGHLGLLKAKLSKLRRELTDVGSGKKGGGGGERGFEVSKSGDTRVGLVGFPSVGKSTLLTKLTGTFSLAAGYEFTTLTAIPGTMHYRGAKIQILDLPGIIEGAKDGKGRGRQVIAAACTCDVILIVLDAAKPMAHKNLIEKELHGFGIRLNQSPPEIVFKRKDKGPINFQAMVPQTTLNQQLVQMICKEYRIMSADVFCRCDATMDQLIDVIEGNRRYIPAIYVLNKIDQLTIEELDIIEQMPHHVPISAAYDFIEILFLMICCRHEWNLEELMENIWEYAKMIRIYTKPKGQIPDYGAPVVLHAHSPSIEDFVNRIHRGIMAQFKYAWVWGSSVRHQPQKCGKDHILSDEDVVQIVKKI